MQRGGEGWRVAEAGPGESVALGIHDARVEVDPIYEGREGP